MKPDQLWKDAIQPLVDRCQNEKGFTNKLLEQMKKLSGRDWHRQQVDKYLHREPKQRHEPRVGMFLLLVQAAKGVK